MRSRFKTIYLCMHRGLMLSFLYVKHSYALFIQQRKLQTNLPIINFKLMQLLQEISEFQRGSFTRRSPARNILYRNKKF